MADVAGPLHEHNQGYQFQPAASQQAKQGSKRETADSMTGKRGSPG